MGGSFLHLLERYVGRNRRQNALYPVSTLLINALPTKEAQAEQKRPHRRTPQDIHLSVSLTSNFWCSCKNVPPTRGLDVALLGKGVEHAQTLYYAQAHPARMRSPLLLTTFNIIKLHLTVFRTLVLIILRPNYRPNCNNNPRLKACIWRKCWRVGSHLLSSMIALYLAYQTLFV